MSISVKTYKYIGLSLTLILPAILSLCPIVYSTDPIANRVIKEVVIWMVFLLLILVIKYGEKDNLSSFTTSAGLLRTAGLSTLITLSMLAISIIHRLLYVRITGSHPSSEVLVNNILKYPPWLKLMLTVRAGIVEEMFYRAYAISRIRQLTENKFLAFTVPLVIFAAGHYSYGSMNHVIGALLLGLVLSFYYLKKNNLIANMASHTIYDSLALFLD